MRHPPKKIYYSKINQLIKIDDSIIDFSGANENILI